MLTISHQQAQRLIRQALDRPLPDEQWTALQAHLESCPDCRAYRARQSMLEKELTRALNHHWSPVPGPLRVPEQVSTQRKRREERAVQARKGFKGVGIALGLFLLGWLFLLFRPIFIPSAPAGLTGAASLTGAAATLVSLATATPDPAIPAFRGTVLYTDALQGVHHDLFLLTGGPLGVEKSQLTGSSVNNSDGTNSSYSDNIDPIWSPDGEWIAFLSNRDDPTGKTYDVYVLSVAGTYNTSTIRLTNDPSLTYHGPLSWSTDGRWIAGVVTSTDGSRAGQWISLVPVESAPPGVSATLSHPDQQGSGAGQTGGPEGGAEGARILARTRGAMAPKFSPSGSRLAFLQNNQLRVFDIGQNTFLTLVNGGAESNHQIDPNFNWSPDGSALVYQVNGSMMEVRSVGSRFVSALTSSSKNNPYLLNTLLTSEAIGPWIASPVWVPNGSVLYLHVFSEFNPCLTMRMVEITNTGPRPASPGWLPWFCAFLPFEQGLDTANWNTGGSWLVLSGYDPSVEADTPQYGVPFPKEQAPGQPGFGIYAMRFPKAGEALTQTPFEKLADARFLAGQPRVRPTVRSLNLTPRAAGKSTAAAHVLKISPGLLEDFSGQIAGITRSNSSLGELVTMPVGRGSGPSSTTFRLRPAADRIACAAAAPQTKRWAFTRTPPNGQGEVMIIVEGDPTPHTVTGTVLRVHAPSALWTYDCPVWSPDGSRIAVVAQVGTKQILQILPGFLPSEGSSTAAGTSFDSSGSYAAEMVPLYPRTITTPPRWLPDGSGVLLGTSLNPMDMARIIRVDTTSGAVTNLISSDGFDAVVDIAVAPESGTIAYLTQSTLPLTANPLTNEPARAPSFTLRLARQQGQQLSQSDLLPYDPNAGVPGYGFMQWRGTGSTRLGYFFRDGPAARTKARIELFSGSANRPQTRVVARIPDEVLAADWSEDGEWLVYSTETGTYLLDLRINQANPILLTDLVFDSLDFARTE